MKTHEEFKSKDAENLGRDIKEYAPKVGIKVNPKDDRVQEVIKGLLMKRKKFGENYCPCRVVTGNKEKDKEIICPCVFNRGEIELQGHCLCQLFVK
jgi:ferredoxin-thioredoxin reductase catalytic subunit